MYLFDFVMVHFLSTFWCIAYGTLEYDGSTHGRAVRGHGARREPHHTAHQCGWPEFVAGGARAELWITAVGYYLLS